MKKIFIIVLALLLVFVVRRNVFAQTAVSSTATFPGGSGADDIDDMAVWVHPTDKSKSIIIGSDKYGDKIFVWEMGGTLIQTITGIGQPGNIDLAYNFPLSGTSTDIVAVNERNTDLVRIYKVNPSTRQLERVDDGNIKTSGDNYGVCFYKALHQENTTPS